MTDQIVISKTLNIRECGYDENWLQEQIATKPSILGLGDLVLVEREKRLLGGGRLDLLLKSRDGEKVFEVEVMLGETDGSHIFRAVEYWDLEESQDSTRDHFAVLVAEEVTRRFFNVIQRLSRSIPIIAIKANIIEFEGRKALRFTSILNAYQEMEMGAYTRSQTKIENTVNEAYWQQKNCSTLESGKLLHSILSPILSGLKITFTKNDIFLKHKGRVCFGLAKTTDSKTVLRTWLSNDEAPAAAALLDRKKIAFEKTPRPSEDWQTIKMFVDEDLIRRSSQLFQEIAKMVERSWENS